MTNRVKGETTRKKILEFLHKYYDKHGYMPSYREIGNALNIKSTASIYAHMQHLIDTGVLQTEHQGCPRAFRFAPRASK